MQLAEAFDFYGAHLETEINADYKNITLFSLSRLLPQTLPLLRELLEEAAFPEDELETWKTRQIQQLRVQKGKVSWLARTAFNREIFGADHLYGHTAQEEEYSALQQANLRELYQMHYDRGNCMLVLSGRFDDKTIPEINRILGSVPQKHTSVTPGTHFLPPHEAHEGLRKVKVEKADAVQSCIRIGKRLFPKTHPDFIELSIVSTILGGYFGSRLMANIREDKGYTYGIGSAVIPQLHSGVFFISTEVGSEVCGPALEEIYYELERLATIPVPDQELELVRNYLMGAFQRSIDGPFGLADRFKSIKLHNLDYQYIKDYQKAILQIDSGTVMELTKKWLSPDTMTEVVAG